MGLISGLITLPLAPARGVVLLARTVERQAEQELHAEQALDDGIEDLQRQHDLGGHASSDVEQAEDMLLEQLMARRAGDLRPERHGGDG